VNKMDSDKFELILDRLLQRTEEGKIEWETTADMNTYLLVLKNSAVSMSYLPDSHCYIFQFRNENGDVIESVNVHSGTTLLQAGKIFGLATEGLQKIENANKFVDSILEQLAA